MALNKMKRALLVMILLSAAAFLSWEALKVRDIIVVGVRTRSSSQVVALSGIELGDSLLALDRERVRGGIEADPYFEYEGVDVDWPSGVIIRVRERIPCAYILYMNSMIVLDKTGFVLKIDPFQSDTELIKVSGLQVSTYLVGQALVAERQDQVVVFGLVYNELEAAGMVGEISEIAVTQALTARLVTLHGMSVELGEGTGLGEKVRIMNSILENLRQTYSPQELSGASLDVSSGKFGDFKPGNRE